MNLKKCTFYVSMGGDACAIDAWTENDKIYSTIYGDYAEAEGKSENYFCKFDERVQVYSKTFGIVEYGSSFKDIPILFELDKKWGYGNPWSNEIFVQSVYDFAWPFGEDSYAVVCKGGVYHEIECWFSTLPYGVPIWEGGGRCGLINTEGKLVIPCEYDVLKRLTFEIDIFSEESAESTFFYLAKRENKWGVIDKDNRNLIPFEWDDLYSCCNSNFLIGEKDVPCVTNDSVLACSPNVQVKYKLFGKELQQVADGLDCEPYECHYHDFSSRDEDDIWQYYILKTATSYGIMRSDGKMIAPIEMTEAETRTRLWGLGNTWYA